MSMKDDLACLFEQLATLDAPSLRERPVADAVIGELHRLGLPVEEDDTAGRIGGTCGNLLCRVPANWALSDTSAFPEPSSLSAAAQACAALPPLLLSTHLDTVGPCLGKKIRLDPDEVFRSDGATILGADDLAGVTAVLALLRELRAVKTPHRPLELLFSVAEESHLQGIAAFDCQRLKAREGYVLDTSGAPGIGVVAAPGHISLRFTVHGRPAHAGIEPEAGISAIAVAARGIAAMRLGRLDAATTANIGQILGGGATNIVAASCLVTAECRSLDLDRLQAQADHMADCMRQAAETAGATLEIERQLSYWPWRVDPDEPVVRRFIAACQAVGLNPRLISTGGGSDLNVLMHNGLRGMVLACGMRHVHTCEECLPLADLISLVQLLQALLNQPI